MRGFDDSALLGTLVVAIDGFSARLAAVRDDDWGRATPCTEWDVRALVNHVVGANVRYCMLLGDEPLADVEATRALDHLGDDPQRAFATTAAEMVASFRAADVYGRVFRHAAGERSGRQLLVMRIYDIGVHTWDLARSIGADERIDADVVAVALTMATPPTDAAEGSSGDSGIPAQHLLLLRSGRQPDKEVVR